MPKTTRAYCCRKPNWIGSSRLWNNRPRPHSLGIGYIAYIFAAWKTSREDIFVGRYFRERIFSREDIFAGRYFRGKIFSREQYIRDNMFSRKYFKFTFREIFLRSKIKCYTVCGHRTGYITTLCRSPTGQITTSLPHICLRRRVVYTSAILARSCSFTIGAAEIRRSTNAEMTTSCGHIRASSVVFARVIANSSYNYVSA